MGVSGKLVSEIGIKSDGDVFHQLWKDKPHEISGMIPHHIQSCDLHQGQWGTLGSIIYWNYVHDGRNCVAKEIIEAIDEEKKSVTFSIIEGDLLELYKTFKVTIHVDTNSTDHYNLVTWTIDYEKLNEDVPVPNSAMELLLSLTKDLEAHHLSNPN